MPSIIGVTLATLNGLYNVHVINATWDVRRPVSHVPTGSGIQIATGLPVASGSFDEVYAIDGSQIDLTRLSQRDADGNDVGFSIQIYDQATQKIKIFAAWECQWEEDSGSSAVEGANTRRKWTWKGKV